jgi:hypothetical protein
MLSEIQESFSPEAALAVKGKLKIQWSVNNNSLFAGHRLFNDCLSFCLMINTISLQKE